MKFSFFFIELDKLLRQSIKTKPDVYNHDKSKIKNVSLVMEQTNGDQSKFVYHTILTSV